MSLTLAIDCSLRWVNLGLGDESKLLGEEAMDTGRKQSEVLPIAVESFLAQHGYSLSDLDRIAVTVGPGYYTGIRVGLSYAASLAESLGIRVVPLNTLFAMAASLFAPNRTTVPVVKARNGAVYTAAYTGSLDTVVETLPPTYLDLPDFVAALNKFATSTNRILIAGGDALAFEEIASSGYPLDSSARTDGASMLAAAKAVAPIDPVEARAVYLRNPD